MSENSEKKPSVLHENHTAYIALVFALLLNLLLIVLLVYFATEPPQIERTESNEHCTQNIQNGSAKGGQTGFNGQTRALNAPAADKEQPTSLTWGKYQVSHSYVMTVPYYHYNVLIYQQTKGAKPTSTDDLDKYFYQPALMMTAQNVRISFNPFTQKYEIQIPVVIWNEAYEEHIRQQIMDQTGKSGFLLSVIPLEEIRVKSVSANPQIQIITRWIAFASQPKETNFRIVCRDNETCFEILGHIKENPQQFADDLCVYYSLESQVTSGKRLTVTAEHVQMSSLYASINQKLPNKDPIYLTSDDANTLQTEIMNNMQATEVEDEDFVSDANQPTLMGLINEALKLSTRSSKGFEEHVWDSVFWNDDNARPDKVTKKLNEVAKKLDAESRSKLKKEQAKSQKAGYKFDASVSYKGVSVGAGASEEQQSNELSEKEVEELKKSLEESRGKTILEGEIYVPKPMELKRVNTGNIRSGAALTTAIVRISKARSQIADVIKVIDVKGQNASALLTSASNLRENEVFHVRCREEYFLFNRAEAKEVCKQYNAKLATTKQVEQAWVAGADWCSAGHLEDFRVAYPGHICFTEIYVPDPTQNRTFDLKQRTVSCDAQEAQKKSFVYKSFDNNSPVNAYKNSWRFGANCWGLKPSVKADLKYNGRLIRVWPFNSTHYSQFRP